MIIRILASVLCVVVCAARSPCQSYGDYCRDVLVPAQIRDLQKRDILQTLKSMQESTFEQVKEKYKDESSGFGFSIPIISETGEAFEFSFNADSDALEHLYWFVNSTSRRELATYLADNSFYEYMSSILPPEQVTAWAECMRGTALLWHEVTRVSENTFDVTITFNSRGYPVDCLRFGALSIVGNFGGEGIEVLHEQLAAWCIGGGGTCLSAHVASARLALAPGDHGQLTLQFSNAPPYSIRLSASVEPPHCPNRTASMKELLVLRFSSPKTFPEAEAWIERVSTVFAQGTVQPGYTLWYTKQYIEKLVDAWRGTEIGDPQSALPTRGPHSEIVRELNSEIDRQVNYMRANPRGVPQSTLVNLIAMKGRRLASNIPNALDVWKAHIREAIGANTRNAELLRERMPTFISDLDGAMTRDAVERVLDAAIAIMGREPDPKLDPSDDPCN